MLHSEFEMNKSISRQFCLIVTLLIGILASGFTPLQQGEETAVSIDSPLPGEAVQGLVLVAGTISVETIQSYQLSFAFTDEDQPDWFTIRESDTLDQDGILGEWDTSTLPDETYDLRLTVILAGEDPIVVLVRGIRVRNYSVIETDTPTPTSEVPATVTPTPEITSTPTPGVTPSPTSLAPNPAEVTVSELQSFLISGGIAGAVFFIMLAAIWRLRQPK
jgi:hypothetical protein